jgi:hypothetical protein
MHPAGKDASRPLAGTTSADDTLGMKERIMGILGWILVASGILLGLFILVLVTGMLLPKAHVISRSLKVKAPPDKLWLVISDFQNVPTWHPEVIRVERLPDHFGQEVWRECYKNGSSIELATMELLPPHRLVRSIADERGPFTGCWQFDISPTEDGSELTITENGEVSNPLFRFMFRLFMDPAASLEGYLRSVDARFGQAGIAD